MATANIRKRKKNKDPTSVPEARDAAGRKQERLATYGYDYKLVGIITLAIVLSIIQYYTLTSMFENDRFFSHLSEMEREMSFRTEMGFYYSYYKTIVNAPTLSEGVQQIISDNVTEYPNTINALQRFNILPEVVLGSLFRLFRAIVVGAGVVTRSCFKIDRGAGLTPVLSCVGIGEPIYFYLTGVFALNGAYLGILFLLATFTSNSILGGILSTSAFIFNLNQCTRVMWTPPLRESFAMPFLFLQLFAVSYIIRKQKIGLKWSMILALPTVAYMLPWQFAQFVMVTQCLALGGLMAINLLNVGVVTTIIGGISLGFLVNIVLQFGNTMLLTSYLPACLIALWITCAVKATKILCCHWLPAIGNCILLFLLIGLTAVLKIVIAMATRIEDDAHIGNLLKAKFTSYKDFHTEIYVCAPEFDFMEPQLPVKLTATLLLPMSLIIALLMLRKIIPVAWKQFSQSNGSEGAEIVMAAENSYHLLQLSAFTVMAVLIMRLKLFFTPYLCLLVGLWASVKIVDLLKSKYHRILLISLLVGSSIFGSLNVLEMLSIEGEYSNVPQEELIDWINATTSENTVFAGAMPIMATVKLTTGRPIVNHPHYEDKNVRERTFMVYQIYGRTPPKDIHSMLKGMGVDMVVVGELWCYQQYRPGCAFLEIWDMVSPHHKDLGNSQFCDNVWEDKLKNKNIQTYFKAVFRNKQYVVLKLL